MDNADLKTKEHVEDNDFETSHVKQATKTRKGFAVLTSIFLVIAVICLILAEIGNTSDKSVIRDIWFIKLNLTNVIPKGTPHRPLVDILVHASLGLEDFYQVGLWNYCDGNFGTGISNCTAPSALYWFDPIQMVTQDLLDGSSLNLPSNLSDMLEIVRVASHWIFGLFLAGTCLSAVLICLVPLSVYTRWNALWIMILSLLNATTIVAASAIGTFMFITIRDEFKSHYNEISIKAQLGTPMFALMWLASCFSVFTFIVQAGLICCCTSRRDIRIGRKTVNENTLGHS